MAKILALMLCMLEVIYSMKVIGHMSPSQDQKTFPYERYRDGYIENMYHGGDKPKCNDINLVILRVIGELGEVDYTCKEFKIHQECLKAHNIDIKNAKNFLNWEAASAYEYLEDLCHMKEVATTEVQRETEARRVITETMPANGTGFPKTEVNPKKDFGEGRQCIASVLHSSIGQCISESKYKVDEDFNLLQLNLKKEDYAKVKECMFGGYNALCHVSRVQEFCGLKAVGEGENVVEIFRLVRKRCQ